MTSQNRIFRLKVSRFEALCQFELTWGEGQSLIARLDYPETLDQLYQDWQQAYLNFYSSRRYIPDPLPSEPSPLRARAVTSGNVMPAVDWQAELIDAETALLREFQIWLWQGELREISKAIAAASRQLSEGADQKIDVLLTCDPLDLVRLPWETWEITDDLAATGKIRIARSPVNIRAEPATVKRPRWKRARILAICCDDVGLNLSQEKQILKSLEPLVSVTLVGWSTDTQQPLAQVRQDITDAITDEQGWDILFFAGHSDETCMAGGRLAIAPGASITIEELRPYLAIAKNRGLQLALFNSCSGLQIAESLIDLGLNQVVIMRERVHNQVAQEFLVQFARSLAAYKDVQEAVQEATQLFLNLNSRKRLQYPSAYLVPSLFRRPGSSLFRLTPPDWRQWIGALLPQNRYELAAISLISLLSLLPPLQTALLNQRSLIQAQYRQITNQIDTNQLPELALIRIDDESISRDRNEIGNPNPMSHQYIGRLVERLDQLNVKVIGVDYLLDRPDLNSDFLAERVRQATDRGVRFVFAKTPTNNGGWLQTPTEITDSRNINADAIRALGTNFHMPIQDSTLEHALPFSYWLVWFHRICIQNPSDLCTQTSTVAQEAFATRYAVEHLPQIYQSPLTSLAYGLARQTWLHPITDFSIPPHQAYTEIPAWKLLHDPNLPELRRLPQQSVMISSGGYQEAGLVPADNVENFTPPAAMQHWYLQQNPQNPYRKMTGGEHMGYLFHHFYINGW
ncbi:MAG: CHASE2 domain-containing protein [Cyanobacteria bacterium RM1_2_2]|nr:CHASE2 domain-containing protein [Cyanobacteria bacterium RM1_2_2]